MPRKSLYIQLVHVPTNRAIVICSALADNFLFLEFLYSGALRRVTAPRGGARGTMGTIIYSAGKIRARPTEHVSDGVKNCFGCTILILLHRYNPPTVCRRLEELFSSIS